MPNDILGVETVVISTDLGFCAHHLPPTGFWLDGIQLLSDLTFHSKMTPSDMAALLLAPKQCCIFIFVLYFLHYYMQPEITFGYQSGGNSPALRTGIRLSRIRTFVRTHQGNWTYPRGCSKTPQAENRYSEWTSSPTQEAGTPSTASEYITP